MYTVSLLYAQVKKERERERVGEERERETVQALTYQDLQRRDIFLGEIPNLSLMSSLNLSTVIYGEQLMLKLPPSVGWTETVMSLFLLWCCWLCLLLLPPLLLLQ